MSIDLSVVIPLYNEEDNVRDLCRELVAVLNEMCCECEVVIVDDGSRDSTFSILKEVAAADERFMVVRLRRNFGQTAALAAGIDCSTGAVIVTMDGDLQNDPADIPGLVAKLNEGYDLVVGWRKWRRDPFFSRQLPSLVANKVISATTQVKLHDYGCGLKALRGELARQLRLYGEMHRFIPAIVADMGASITEITVNHRPRQRGQSKYGISRTIRVMLDLVTVKFLSSFATRPIHVFGTGGLLAFVLGMGITGFLGAQKILLGIELSRRPLLLLGILLIVTGVQLITLGLIGEILVRTYHESQAKPIYLVRERLGKPSRTPVLIKGGARSE